MTQSFAPVATALPRQALPIPVALALFDAFGNRLKIARHGVAADIDEAVILPVYYYVGVQFFNKDKLRGVQTNLIDDHPFRCMYWK